MCNQLSDHLLNNCQLLEDRKKVLDIMMININPINFIPFLPIKRLFQIKIIFDYL